MISLLAWENERLESILRRNPSGGNLDRPSESTTIGLMGLLDGLDGS
jgi:hypothetical protein